MIPILALFNMGGGEIVLIMGVILLLFGAKKLPELAKGLGQGIKEFKKASNDMRDEIERAGDVEEPPHSPPAYPERKMITDVEAKTVPDHSDHPDLAQTVPQSDPKQS